MKVINYKVRCYIFTFLLIALTAIPVFKSSLGFYSMVIALLIFFKRFSFDWKEILFLVVMAGLEIFHFFHFRNYDIFVVRQVFFFFISAVYLANYINLNYFRAFIDIIYYFTLISFPIFLLFFISADLVKSLAALTPSFFVSSKIIYLTNYVSINPVFYNFDHNYYLGRNNGPFWEPTVFASILVIAQIFNFFLTKKIANKVGIVFTLGIITTLSTTGFLAYAVFLLGYYLFYMKGIILKKVAVITITIMLGTIVYESIPFLKDKINSEIENLDSDIERFGGASRIASAYLDVQEIKKDPLYLFLGKGSTKFYRIGAQDKDVIRNCGLTALLVEWGLPFFIFYFTAMLYSFKQLTKLNGVHKGFSVIFLIVILILSFSEVFLDFPLFHLLLFLGPACHKFSVVRKVKRQDTSSSLQTSY